MPSLATRRRCAGAACAAGMLILTPVPAGAATPAPATVVVRCSGAFTMTAGGFTGAAQGRGELTCAVPGRPEPTSATLRMRGSFSGRATAVTTATEDTLTFDTGQVTRFSATRTFVTDAGRLAETGEGVSTSGDHHPATATESGRGTTRSGGDVTVFTVDDGFTLELAG
ncbi:hypothetical protein BLA24_04640 [Streptomyces cinnamoneus]|uniref:Uncharacterized protein n=1 Tax=Streptomyces cinnamoneus TaxID=53446 RepID=A0A2G1XNU7_STRCJ|nr:hypothetical protein [Streptomyces cinnamoneus]PHQ52861.1 hypothetical protein BLA24_04640 [Streptomyces cinnamoneus]PPT11480.1 hypothetical protein CYQ11_28890 [Streptomyces cinnamoneus]